jgi:NADH:ubiquinone reductase (H+-translocating)
MTTKTPLVVIVGGGFGGLAAAKGLKRSPVEILLIDRSNHHVFQPLLYQVATAVLAPGQIASPIRSLLAEQANTSVILGDVTGVDAAARQVIVDAGDKVGLRISYDYLILATGASHSYFGHDEFAAFAPGLKSLSDAEALRNHILEAFEKAETEENPDRQQALMSFGMVGAGPTGVEMASALAILVRTTLRRDFRRVDPKSARIVLADMGARPLATFSEKLSEAAKRRLVSLGIDVRLRYCDKGNLAVVGKNFAVLQSAGVQLSGFLAWLVWGLIHIQFLAESSLRFSVFLQWVWTYVSGKRGERLIIRRRTSD